MGGTIMSMKRNYIYYGSILALLIFGVYMFKLLYSTKNENKSSTQQYIPLKYEKSDTYKYRIKYEL